MTTKATQHRTIRLEITVDPLAYAREHGVEVWAALDHATARVVAAATQAGRNDEALEVERTNIMGGVVV